MTTFYLGTHEPSWLQRTQFPLFVSRRRLSRLKSFRPALGNWALDSGGFTELNLFGRWSTTPKQYATEVELWAAEIGRLDFAAVQDWMCEPFVTRKTGKCVREHQDLTIQSYLDLSELAPSMPWMPVLQGWGIDEYMHHAEQYASAGVDLSAAPRVGVGSVCRRQKTREGQAIFESLRPLGLPLHGFGLKTTFIRKAGFRLGLASFDSLAWSFAARKLGRPIEGCTGHKTCANCFRYAMLWQENVCSIGSRQAQMLLEMGAR